MWVSQWHTQLSSLWPEESATGYRHSSHHILACDTLHHLPVGMHHIRVGDTLVAFPTQVIDECPFYVDVAHLIASAVEVEQTVKPDRNLGAYKRAFGGEGLQSAAGTHSHYL